jgi:hypothetical protein
MRTVNIGQLRELEVPPSAFIGIQFRRVAGQAFEPNPTGGLFQRGFHGTTAIDRRTVPDHQQWFIDGESRTLEKTRRKFAADAGFERLERAATIASDTADHRQMPARLSFGEARRLTDGSPGRSDCRQRTKPRYIHQHDRLSLGLDFFSAASSGSSAARRWRPRPAVERDAAAFADSSRTHATASPHAAVNVSRRIRIAAPRPLVAESRGCRESHTPPPPLQSARKFCCRWAAINRGGYPDALRAARLCSTCLGVSFSHWLRAPRSRRGPSRYRAVRCLVASSPKLAPDEPRVNPWYCVCPCRKPLPHFPIGLLSKFPAVQ